MKNWNDLLANKLAASHRTSLKELNDLRAVVTRNLADASIEGVSPDQRFALQYDIALMLAKMAIACSGYRIKGAGAHYATFIALPLACGRKANRFSQYFNRCRKKRNRLTYDQAGIVTETETEELATITLEFREFIEDWIRENHPKLAHPET